MVSKSRTKTRELTIKFLIIASLITFFSLIINWLFIGLNVSPLIIFGLLLFAILLVIFGFQKGIV